MIRHLHPRPRVARLSLVFALALGVGSPARAQGDAAEVAASAPGAELTFDELDEALVWRHALSQDGRASLRQLLEHKLLAHLAMERDVEVSAADLNTRWDELDRQTKAGGEAGLREYLAKAGIDPQVFRELLRLSIVLEKLTRLALGIDEDAPLESEQQNMWLQAEIEGRGYEELPHPWTGGVVAKCGGLEISRDDLCEYLRRDLPDDLIREACFQLLLQKKILARMPDVSDETIAREIEVEIERRRKNVEANPLYQGVAYEQLLGTQGLSLDALRRDASVKVAALAHMWIDRSHTDRDLRDVYEVERSFFDGLFGEALELRLLVLQAAEVKNELNPRTFDEATVELQKLRARIEGVEDFERLAALHSEEPRSRQNGGRVGFVTRGSPSVPEPIRLAAFRAFDGSEDGDVAGELVGPVRLQGACALILVGERRPAPTWEVMSVNIHRELRRRFVAETLSEGDVSTWMDAK